MKFPKPEDAIRNGGSTILSQHRCLQVSVQILDCFLFLSVLSYMGKVAISRAVVATGQSIGC